MVVAGDGQHPAVFRYAGGVGVFKHVAGAVDARPFAVPKPEYAIIFCAFGAVENRGLLAAPYGGRGQVFVQPRLKMNLVIG